MSAQPRIPILIIIPSLDSGGAERHLLQVLPRLDPSRFCIEVFPLRTHGVLIPKFKERGIHVHENAGGRLQRLRALAALIRQRHPVVHCFLPEAYLLGAPLALASRAKVCLMSRRSRNHYQARHRIAGWLERHLHPFMRCILANSRAVAEDLYQEGVAAEHIRLIYNGIAVERFAVGPERSRQRVMMRQSLDIPEDTTVLCCVANLFPYKGHADLLDALSRLGRTFADNGLLLLVGRDAGMEKQLRAQITVLGLDQHVRFLGEREDVAEILAASDIGVLASHEEGFSNAVLEVMAAGLPIVVTDVGGNAEAVLDGVCGHVVPRQNTVALSAALSDLMTNPARRSEYGFSARQRVGERFSIDACAYSYTALYEECWTRPEV